MTASVPSGDALRVLDRYAAFTDLALLKEASARPLRKSIRVNTIKCSVERFKKWGADMDWQLTPVPWCTEAFFIDREDRSKALGRDLLHLIGAAYMQEAASMLPVEILNVQPGQSILDMSAAPGSKSTQIAAKLQGKGLVVCNDVQEKRLWTLKTALHRSGVSNYVMTKKVGQWFMKHMTERFDRVLCDAPCTAQGTSRKDSDALIYCSAENIGKMASLQRELLESAVAAAKVGGLIVYSTCTLTPEENEEVVLSMLKKFPGQLEVVDPRTELRVTGYELQEIFNRAIEDSARVQETLGPETRNPKLETRAPLPMLRLWPHVCDVEGFFAAVLRKTGPTRAIERMEWKRPQEIELPRPRQRDIGEHLTEMYGHSLLLEGDVLYERGEQILLSSESVRDFPLPVIDYALGIPFAKRLDGGRIRLSTEGSTLRGPLATKNMLSLSEEDLRNLLDGKDLACAPELRGDMVLLHEGFCIGTSLAKEGKLMNRLPRWVVQRS